MNLFNKKRETPPPSQFDLKPHIEAITILWTGKKKEEKKEEKKGFVKTVKDMWNDEEVKRGYESPFSNKTKKEKSWIQKAVRVTTRRAEPPAVAGVSCGEGFMAGLGLTHDLFLGPRFSVFDDELKLVFGFGQGCVIGFGMGYGLALGYIWDDSENPERKVN